MSLTCSKILELPYSNQLKFVAGREAAANRIRWVHYLEDPAYVKWLKGGELIIISGSVIGNDKEKLIQLIDQLYEYNVAGVIINLSDYIKEISADVIKEANELQLPLFEMAAQIRIVDISQSICYAIFQDQRIDQQNTHALLEILYGQRISDRRIERLKDIGIVDGVRYRAIEIKAFATTSEEVKDFELYDDDQSARLLNEIKFILGRYFKSWSERICDIQDSDTMLIIIPDKDHAEITQEATRLYHAIKKKIPNVQVTIAIGTTFEYIRDLKRCYEVTHNILQCSLKDGIVDDYENILRKMMIEYSDTADLKMSAEYTLGDLLKEENQELLNTLIIYLRNGQSVKDTASQMYVHTNTIHYRITKIQEMLGYRFSNYEKFFQLQVCLEIYRMLNSTK